MRKKLFLLALVVGATCAATFSAPRVVEAAICNKSCCGIDVCTCCHPGCLCPR